MDKITAILILIACVILSPTGAGAAYTPVAVTLYKDCENKEIYSIRQEQVKIEAIERAEIEIKRAEMRLKTFSGLKQTKIEDYGFISFPYSHFKLDNNSSYGQFKKYMYLDNMSSIEVSIKTGLSQSDIDNPGRNICGLDDEPEADIKLINGYKVIRLRSNTLYDGYKRASWCIIKSDSALIINAYIYDGTDYSIFCDAVDTAIPTVSIYYVQNIVFDTPKGGYYETVAFKTSEQGKKIYGNQNVGDNTVKYVGGEYEGTVRTNKVSDNWRELKLVLDNNTISLNERMQFILDKGFNISGKPDRNFLVNKGAIEKLELYQENGIVITVEVVNNTSGPIRLDNTDVKSLEIDTNRFGNVGNLEGSKYNKERLPDLIFTSGITWNIAPDNILRALNEEPSVYEQDKQDNRVIEYNSYDGKRLYIRLNKDNQIEYLKISE